MLLVQGKVLDLSFEDEKGPGDTFSSAAALQVLLSSLGDRSEHRTHNGKSCAGDSMAGFSSGVLWGSGASSIFCNHQFLHSNCRFLMLKSALEINLVLA